ncbi:MAG: zinc-ribbon domain-containing protein [Phycisphaerae bacterium]|nr:zinc-ribbon domain-containing protein [Saprospiraceae bacterium]
MFVFGKKDTTLRSERMFGKKCPNCSAAGTTEMRVLAQYVHFYWIPFFPLSKKGVSQCEQCKQKLEFKDMPSSFQMEYEAMRDEVKAPIWHFAGLGALAILLAFAWHSNKVDNENDLLYLNNPQVGDRYEIKTDLLNYTLMKVATVKGDTIGVQANAMQVSKSYKLINIDKPQNYHQLVEPMLKSELMEMFTSGELMNVNR